MSADIIHMNGEPQGYLVTMARATSLLRYSVREMMLLTMFHQLPLPEEQYNGAQPLYDYDELLKWKQLREGRLRTTLIL